MSKKQYFNFYGVGVEIRSFGARFDEVQRRLGEDFQFFSSIKLPVKIELHLLELSRLPRIKPLLPRAFRTRMCQAYGFFGTRYCDYGPDLKVISKSAPAPRRIYILGNSDDALAELALITLLSSVGEELDLLGFHRIHGLGFERDGQAWLLPLRSGGGKSSIAALMLGDVRYRLYSDEIPMIKKGTLFAFPLRVALLPQVALKLKVADPEKRIFRRRIFPEKVLINIPASRVAQPLAPRHLLWVGDTRLGMMISLVLGLGVPQFAEYMLRVDNLLRLFKIALSRLVMATHLMVSARIVAFDLSVDPVENKKRLDSMTENVI